jgi:hypothetical protein
MIGNAVTVVGAGYGLFQDWRRRTKREWIYMAIVNLKLSIQGENRDGVIKVIDNMLESSASQEKIAMPRRHEVDQRYKCTVKVYGGR